MNSAAANVRAPAATPRPVNQEAEQITGRDHLSHSQLASMRQCPRKFWHQYVDHSEPDFVASSLLFGAAVHHAVELHFRSLMEGLTVGADTLCNAFLDCWHGELIAAGK